MNRSFRIIILGLSITSSWGNGHATTYRGLVREMARRGHRILFLERDMPRYAQNRDMPKQPGAEVALYQSVDELQDRYSEEVRHADAVIVGSYVPDGIAVGEWVTRTAEGTTAFYDIDTPVTVQALADGRCEYLSRQLIPKYCLYFSFSGGPILRHIEQELGARKALPLYSSVDPDKYYSDRAPRRWDLGYLGTYSDDRQPGLERLLIGPALRWSYGSFVVAGAQYPEDVRWPQNIQRIEHLSPDERRTFYNSQRFTLNITRTAMAQAGYSPGVRLFEAAACGAPVISDWWKGLDEFFVPEREILIAESPEDCLRYIRDMRDDERRAIGQRAREAVLASHTAAKRAEHLEDFLISESSDHIENWSISGHRAAASARSGGAG